MRRKLISETPLNSNGAGLGILSNVSEFERSLCRIPGNSAPLGDFYTENPSSTPAQPRSAGRGRQSGLAAISKSEVEHRLSFTAYD